MPKKIDFDKSLGEFVTEYPQSRKVFEKFDLDYCCGGKKNIKLAAMEKNIVFDILKDSLKKSIEETKKNEKTKKWENESLTNIIDYIEEKHHKFTWKKLSSIYLLLNKLDEIHGDKYGNLLVNLKDIFSKFKLKLQKHLLIEEDIVFNYIKLLEKSFDKKHKKYVKDSRFTKEIIDILTEEHEETGEILKKIRNLTSNYELPDYACLTFEALYESLQSLEDDLHEHVQLENTTLFPRIENLIGLVGF